MNTLCAPSAHSNPRDGFLSLLTTSSSPSTAGMRPQTSSCKAESSTESTFSWSDFPILGQGASSDVPAMVEIEDLWSASEDSASTDSSSSYSLSSEDSVSRRSSLSVCTLEEEELVVVKKEERPKVRFSNVLSIRTFDVTLGDHPCCVGGMALTCSWTHAEQDELIDLDVYERYAPKRSMHELRLCYHERRCRLQAAMNISPAQLLQLEYEMVCAAPMNALRPCSSVKSSLQELSADL